MTSSSPAVQRTYKGLSGYALAGTAAAYALVLLAGILTIPLRVPEILQIAADANFTFSKFLGWIPQAPGSAPLNYFLQLPFVLVGGDSRFAVRLVSFICALAAAYLFLRLAKRVPLQRPYWALLLFLALPLHLLFATDGRPFEQGLFLLLLATDWFFRLIDKPGFLTGSIYTAVLTLCLYTAVYSYVPAIGYLFFLLRFVNGARERRAMWFVLGSSVVPLLLFLPYFLWALPKANADWLSALPLSGHASNTLRTLESFAPVDWVAYTLSALLCAGFIAAILASFRNRAWGAAKRLHIFCLAGSVLSTLFIIRVLIQFTGETFSPGQVLWTVPALVLLFSAALEWIAKARLRRVLSPAVAAVAVLISAYADAQYLLHPGMNGPTEDMRLLAESVPAELTPDSCVVFVSERFSRYLFLEFEPSLAKRECMDFFHHAVVLASHPYVRPDQQEDAESFFRGLSFHETKRLVIGGGQIVVMRQ